MAPVAATLLLLVLLSTGCADWSPSSAPSAAGKLDEIGAVNGTWKDAESQSTWETVLVSNRVHAIREQINLYGSLTGSRLYEFDSIGTLRRFSERLYSRGDSATSTNIRESTIEFITNEPAMATRKVGDRPMGFRRLEMFALQSRGYALMDSAIQYSERARRRQSGVQ